MRAELRATRRRCAMGHSRKDVGTSRWNPDLWRSNAAGIFVAFEESSAQIVANASTFGWDLPALIKKKLFFLDAQLSPDVVKSGEFDLIGMLNVLHAKALAIHATHIVFDGIDVLLGLLDDPAAERREIYRIRDWLAATGLTGIITQKVGHEADHRYSFLHFMVDCVVVLRHQVVDGSAFRNLRVLKYRGSGFAGDEFPISLGAEGMQLTNRGPGELVYKVSNERISSGLPRLDHMLNGGFYHRAASNEGNSSMKAFTGSTSMPSSVVRRLDSRHTTMRRARGWS